MTSVGSNFLCGRPHGADPSHIPNRPTQPDLSPSVWTSYKVARFDLAYGYK